MRGERTYACTASKPGHALPLGHNAACFPGTVQNALGHGGIHRGVPEGKAMGVAPHGNPRGRNEIHDHGAEVGKEMHAVGVPDAPGDQEGSPGTGNISQETAGRGEGPIHPSEGREEQAVQERTQDAGEQLQDLSKHAHSTHPEFVQDRRPGRAGSATASPASRRRGWPPAGANRTSPRPSTIPPEFRRSGSPVGGRCC